MRRTLRDIVSSQSGFTFTELLITVVVVTLASAMVAVGVPTAVRTYAKVVDTSNSQALLSTTTTQLREELAFSSEWKVDANTVTYTSDYDNKAHAISLAASGNAGELQKDSKAIAITGASSGKDLGNLYVTCESIALEGTNVVKFTNVQVKKTGTNEALATAAVFEVRMLQDKAEV